MERLGLSVAAPEDIKHRQIVEADGNIKMVRPQGSPRYRQRTLDHAPLFVFPGLLITGHFAAVLPAER